MQVGLDRTQDLFSNTKLLEGIQFDYQVTLCFVGVFLGKKKRVKKGGTAA